LGYEQVAIQIDRDAKSLPAQHEEELPFDPAKAKDRDAFSLLGKNWKKHLEIVGRKHLENKDHGEPRVPWQTRKFSS
jgi:hypothetical protein